MSRSLGIVLLVLMPAGCELWLEPPLPPGSLDHGIIVLYPGGTNTSTEMVGLYTGLAEAGLPYAIDIHHYAPQFDHFLFPIDAFERLKVEAAEEARRLSEYKTLHPDCPVTVIGYSGGAMMAIRVAESMPTDVQLDRVILLSSAVSRRYDLENALNGAARIVAYHSPVDTFTPIIGSIYRLYDLTLEPPAATFGFDMTHERLEEFYWEPSMQSYGHNGGHIEYIFLPAWIRDFVAPRVATETGA